MDTRDQLWIQVHNTDEAGEDERFWDPEWPLYFRLGLEPEVEKGDTHIRRSNPEPRSVVTSFHSESKTPRPAFQVSGKARAIIHGTLDEITREPATLLVHEFTLLAHRSAHINKATIKLEFVPSNTRFGPLVKRVAPIGGHTLQAASGGVCASISAAHQVAHGARVIGQRPADQFGHSVSAEWTITQSDASQQGVPWRFIACVLLARQPNDDFSLIPTIKAYPDLTTRTGTSLLTKRPGAPIIFDTLQQPHDDLGKNLESHRWSLASVDLDALWGWDYERSKWNT